jgi:hypothetical protein
MGKCHDFEHLFDALNYNIIMCGPLKKDMVSNRLIFVGFFYRKDVQNKNMCITCYISFSL